MGEQLEQQKKQGKGSMGLAYASILIAASLWGFIGLWTRSLMGAGLSSYTVAALRNGGGFLVLTAIFLVKDRSVFHIEKKHFKYFLGTGIASLTLFSASYFACQSVCSLAVSSVLLYTAPSFVVLLSAILWKEPITKKKVAALLLTLLGCAFVCGLFSNDVTVTLKGFLLGLGAGFFYALYSIFGRYALDAGYDSMTVTVWTFLIAGPVSILVFARPAEVASMTPNMWLLALGMAVFSTALPYLFYTKGLSKVEAGKASIMASLEPVVASLSGIIIFGEPLGLSLVGVALVLAGVYILR